MFDYTTAVSRNFLPRINRHGIQILLVAKRASERSGETFVGFLDITYNGYLNLYSYLITHRKFQLRRRGDW